MSLAREKAAREAERERVAREQAAREQAAREQAAREAAERERVAREQAAREAAERERVAREQAAREAAEREQATREAAERERVAREQAAREEAAREQAAREAAEKEKVITDWFCCISLGAIEREKYSKLFIHLGFDGLTAISLIEEKEMDVYFPSIPVGHRKIIWQQIQTLKKLPGNTTSTTTNIHHQVNVEALLKPAPQQKSTLTVPPSPNPQHNAEKAVTVRVGPKCLTFVQQQQIVIEKQRIIQEETANQVQKQLQQSIEEQQQIILELKQGQVQQNQIILELKQGQVQQNQIILELKQIILEQTANLTTMLGGTKPPPSSLGPTKTISLKPMVEALEEVKIVTPHCSMCGQELVEGKTATSQQVKLPEGKCYDCANTVKN